MPKKPAGRGGADQAGRNGKDRKRACSTVELRTKIQQNDAPDRIGKG